MDNHALFENIALIFTPENRRKSTRKKTGLEIVPHEFSKIFIFTKVLHTLRINNITKYVTQ
jgi:hypothetical protein